ncbi:MAG: hypothetical protein KA248_14280 [Kiritimatiellae bacterium]|nr:hypothetical protein [Kiritimatiellia bacterium]
MQTKAVILGMGAPNRCRDGRATMCAIALSREYGLIRIYPLRVGGPDVRVWSVCELEAEPTSKDTRKESWRLLNIHLVGAIERREHRADILSRCLLQSAGADPVEFQNRSNLSVAVVEGSLEAAIMSRGEGQEPPNCGEADSWIHCQKESPLKPMLRWRSAAGACHESHIVSREAYEFLRKFPLDASRLFTNYQVFNPEYRHWLVLGNMKNRRNVWVVVHIHRMKLPVRSESGHEFSVLQGAGWPYWNHFIAAAKTAEEPQQVFSFLCKVATA